MMNIFFSVVFAAAAASLATQTAGSVAVAATLKVADIGNGITLHYVDEGRGIPVIFVHGSISDYTYWDDQLGPFSKRYRAIAYSRRYDYPNHNPARPGYSAITDADDLAAFIRALHLGKVNVVGHSYGALAALFLAARHPEMVNRIVLAEPPAVSLLQHLSGADAALGRAEYHDIQRRMVAPMQAAFRSGQSERGVATFVDYVYQNRHEWSSMQPDDRAMTLRDAHEWDVMMTGGTLFPAIAPSTVRSITVPVMILSGAASYPFLRLIDDDLAKLLPYNEHVIVSGAGHQMWYQQPDLCRATVEAFLDAKLL